LAVFKERLGRYFSQAEAGLGFAFDDIYVAVNEGLTGDEAFDLMETEAGLLQMSNENKIMYNEGTVYLI
jgi:DNA replication licensing factor MCM3